MIDSLKNRLKELADEKGMSFREISIQATGRDSLIKNWFRRGATTNPRIDSLQKIADILDCDLDYLVGKQENKKIVSSRLPRGLSVAGTIQAGNWVDVSQAGLATPATIPLAENPKYKGMKQYALKVKGESMNLFAPDGSYVICVSYADLGIDIKQGMRIHIERSLADGQLVEATLKRVLIKDRKFILEPESNLKQFQKITFDPKAPDDVVIKGIVIGRYQQEDF